MNARKLFPRIIRACCAVMAFALAGCFGYRLGSTLPPDLRTVYVPMFVNECREPLVEVETTKAVIGEFQKDGTLRVKNEGNADSVLEVTLTDYFLEPVRYDRDNPKATSEYRLRIKAHIIFKRTGSDDMLVSEMVEGETVFDPGADLFSSKRSALPKAADDLAHDIVEKVVEYW